jgi:hypothetical protein
MDPTRFDRLVRSLDRMASRRGAFGIVVGALALLGDAAPGLTTRRRHKGIRHRRQVSAAEAGGISACVEFCAEEFGAGTPAARTCTRDAATGPSPDVCRSRQQPGVLFCEPARTIEGCDVCSERPSCGPEGCPPCTSSADCAAGSACLVGSACARLCVVA